MKKFLEVFIIFLIIPACASIKLSTHQRRALQVRTFSNVSYDNVFKAAKTVLLDNGYTITNQDYKGGMILAMHHTTDEAEEFWSKLGDAIGTGMDGKPRNSDFRMGETFEVSINLDRIANTTVETRLVLQKIEHMKFGGKKGKEIVEPETYKTFYDRLMVEIERRKAKGRH